MYTPDWDSTITLLTRAGHVDRPPLHHGRSAPQTPLSAELFFGCFGGLSPHTEVVAWSGPVDDDRHMPYATRSQTIHLMKYLCHQLKPVIGPFPTLHFGDLLEGAGSNIIVRPWTPFQPLARSVVIFSHGWFGNPESPEALQVSVSPTEAQACQLSGLPCDTQFQLRLAGVRVTFRSSRRSRCRAPGDVVLPPEGGRKSQFPLGRLRKYVWITCRSPEAILVKKTGDTIHQKEVGSDHLKLPKHRCGGSVGPFEASWLGGFVAGAVASTPRGVRRLGTSDDPSL